MADLPEDSLKMAELLQELINSILILLPVKTLIRFKSVSKSWNFLISSPNFTHRHLNQTLITNPNPQNLLISQNRRIVTTAITSNDLRFTELDHPFKHIYGNSDAYMFASYHGIVLVSDYLKRNMYLFNPVTSSHRLLPAPAPAPFSEPTDLHEFYGFGYDGLSDDYKVVRLLQWVDDGRRPCREASVYSLRDDVWKLAKYEKYEIKPYYLPTLQQGVVAKEMLHFIGIPGDFTPVLKCFDLRTEEFLNVDCPELESNDFSKMVMGLNVFQGCLWLIVNYQKHQVGVSWVDSWNSRNREFLYADVWEMRERGKKESWVKLFRIRKREIVQHCASLRLVTYSEDKGSVLIHVSSMWYGWYDLVSKRIERVAVHGWQEDDSPCGSVTFVESLVSVSNDKVVSKAVTSARKTKKKNDFLSSGFKLRL